MPGPATGPTAVSVEAAVDVPGSQVSPEPDGCYGGVGGEMPWGHLKGGAGQRRYLPGRKRGHRLDPNPTKPPTEGGCALVHGSSPTRDATLGPGHGQAPCRTPSRYARSMWVTRVRSSIPLASARHLPTRQVVTGWLRRPSGGPA